MRNRALAPILVAALMAWLTMLPLDAHAEAQHFNYDILPTGYSNLGINFDTGYTGYHYNLRFVFGGDQDLRIQRVATLTGSPAADFADASPHVGHYSVRHDI